MGGGEGVKRREGVEGENVIEEGGKEEKDRQTVN